MVGLREAFDRVGHRVGQAGGTIALGGFDEQPDKICGEQGPGAVVDQGVGGPRGQAFEAPEDGKVPFLAPFYPEDLLADGGAQTLGQSQSLGLVSIDDGDEVDSIRVGKGLEGVAENGASLNGGE